MRFPCKKNRVSYFQLFATYCLFWFKTIGGSSRREIHHDSCSSPPDHTYFSLISSICCIALFSWWLSQGRWTKPPVSCTFKARTGPRNSSWSQMLAGIKEAKMRQKQRWAYFSKEQRLLISKTGEGVRKASTHSYVSLHLSAWQVALLLKAIIYDIYFYPAITRLEI